MKDLKDPDEEIDILDEDGHYTGETVLKSKAHREGIFHPTTHVWMYTKDGQIVLQQRGKDKDTFPLLWSVSAAGHIGAGEDILLSAAREVNEEIGVTINTRDLEKIGIFRSVHKHNNGVTDCEYVHSFICELKVPFHQLKKQDSEVENLAIISLMQFAEETWGLANPKKYVPHSPEYFKTVIKAIRKKL